MMIDSRWQPESGPPSQHRAAQILLALATLALGWILLPLFGILLWAVIIAMLFVPVYRRLLPMLRRRRTPAALLTLLIALVMVILPLVFVAASMATEAAGLYQRLQSGETNPVRYFQVLFNSLPRGIRDVLDRFGMFNFDTVQRRLTLALSQGAQVMGGQVLDIGQNTFEFLASFMITLYLAFFMIRDGEVVVHALRRVLPLTVRHKQELLDKFITVVRATVKGNLLVAAIQGALGGLAFWYLGVGAAVLWAVLMAFLSLLPAVGAALVWVPVALYFFAMGAVWQAAALVAWGVLVIGLVDNLLRPMLVGKDTRMPDYVVMLTTLGGMAVFGIHGFVLGPTIAAMFIAVWQIFETTGAAPQAHQDVQANDGVQAQNKEPSDGPIPPPQ